MSTSCCLVLLPILGASAGPAVWEDPRRSRILKHPPDLKMSITLSCGLPSPLQRSTDISTPSSLPDCCLGEKSRLCMAKLILAWS
ncbi:hypothetical protein BJ508DRAFT_118402 [Ascobolus immersus RN42]|uniref:Hydrophobin n=1 Tax=Ascobolus immersus RN42 TaxID=1160509 RepID=A0A3N4IH96_ASCIM|nr:hypothetical protein BJ508DRAFT_118402 [Ascobolus immersus RN42]